MLPPSKLYKVYAETAGKGALVELAIRLLADLSDDPALQAYAYSGDLDDAEKEIVRVFADTLSADDVALLERCRTLRSKIMHCNFPAVRKRLDATEPTPVMQQAPADAMIAALVAAKEGDDSKLNALVHAAPQVTELSFRKGRLYGWFAHFVANGEWVDAQQVFADAVKVIERLRDSKQSKASATSRGA